MEKFNVSNKSAQEARYHDAANDTFTHSSFYTQTPLHTDAFTHRRF